MSLAPPPVALVTGAARRIGAVVARTLHDAGYSVAIHYRSAQGDAEALAAEFERARPGTTLLLRADLDAFDRLPELVAQTVGRFGRLDVLVNNASTFIPTGLGTTTPAQWDALFASNARAPFFLAQAAAPHLRQARGAIVNLLDVYAEHPLRDHAVYSIAKAAQLAMTRALAIELGPDVRVNGVSPGAILWPEGAAAPDEMDRQAALVARTPLARTGTPEDIASAVVWLLRDAAFVTGEVIRVDGGRMLAG